MTPQPEPDIVELLRGERDAPKPLGVLSTADFEPIRPPGESEPEDPLKETVPEQKRRQSDARWQDVEMRIVLTPMVALVESLKPAKKQFFPFKGKGSRDEQIARLLVAIRTTNWHEASLAFNMLVDHHLVAMDARGANAIDVRLFALQELKSQLACDAPQFICIPFDEVEFKRLSQK